MTPTQADTDDTAQELTQEDFAIGDTVIDREQDDPDTAVVVNRPPMAAQEWEAYQVSGEPVTVAEDNPDYDPTSQVVVVIFLDDLNKVDADWDGDQPLALADVPKGIDYAFPPARLNPVGTYAPDNQGETADDSPAEDDTTDETADPSDEQTQETTSPDNETVTKDSSTQTQETATGDEMAPNEDAPEQPSSGDDSAVQERLDAIAGVVRGLNIDDVTVDSSKEVVIVEKLGEQYEIDTNGSVNADGLLAQRLQDAIAEQIDE